MLQSTVSNAIMNASRVGDIDNSHNDIDSSFIETPVETPRRPLAKINDINIHNRQRGEKGIHSGPVRVPVKEKTPGKATRTPNTKKQNRAGYLAMTEAYRLGDICQLFRFIAINCFSLTQHILYTEIASILTVRPEMHPDTLLPGPGHR